MSTHVEDVNTQAGPDMQTGKPADTGPTGMTGAAEAAGQPNPGMQSPGMGHMHLTEHITGIASNAGMAAAQGPTTSGGPGSMAGFADPYGMAGPAAAPFGPEQQGSATGYQGVPAGYQGGAQGGMGGSGCECETAASGQSPTQGPAQGQPLGGVQGPAFNPGPAPGPAQGPEGCQHHVQQPGMAGQYYGPFPGGPQPGPQPSPFPGAFPGGPQPGPFPGAFPGGPQPGPQPGPFPGAMGQPQGQPGDANSGGCGCGGHTAGPEQGFNDYGTMFGHVSGMVNDFMNGRTPDAQKVMGMLESCSSQFWKGAAVGAGLGLLLSSNAVRETISGMVCGVFGGKSSTTSANE